MNIQKDRNRRAADTPEFKHLPCVILSQMNTSFLFLQDQILRKPNGLAMVLFTDFASVQRVMDYYNSGQAFMYGTPFVISTLNVDIMADSGSEQNAEAKARSVTFLRSLTNWSSFE